MKHHVANRLNPKVFPPVGRCVYCGSDGLPKGLSTEHIIAFGLSGSGLLPKASCAACSVITGQLEQACLRTNFIDYRVHAKLPTRRPKERPTELEIFLSINGSLQTRKLPINQHPHFLCMPVLPVPRFFAGLGPTSDLRLEVMFVAYDPADVKSKLDKLAPATLTNQVRFHVVDFIRMLAKIAHCYAIAELGVDAVHSMLPPLILGQDTTIAQCLVGGTDVAIPIPPYGPKEKAAGLWTLHQMRLVVRPLLEKATGARRWLVTVAVRLFALHSAPTYEIIVGELRPTHYDLLARYGVNEETFKERAVDGRAVADIALGAKVTGQTIINSWPLTWNVSFKRD